MDKNKIERQLLDKAIKQVHTDKMQVNDVIKKLPKNLHSKFLDELDRRGSKPYPEKGPNTKGSDVKGNFSELTKMLKKK